MSQRVLRALLAGLGPGIAHVLCWSIYSLQVVIAGFVHHTNLNFHPVDGVFSVEKIALTILLALVFIVELVLFPSLGALKFFVINFAASSVVIAIIADMAEGAVHQTLYSYLFFGGTALSSVASAILIRRVNSSNYV